MLLTALLLITSLQYRKEPVGNWFGKQECTSLRGITAIYLVLFHIHMLTSFSSPWVWVLYPINSFIILANGLFFFISGWGLWESKITKPGYLQLSSLVVRLLKLLVPVYLIYVMYCFIKMLIGDVQISLSGYLSGVWGRITDYLYFNDVLWFVIELCFLYIFFWILYGNISKEKSNIIFFILIALWIVWAVYSGRGIVWYASTYCFLSGILLSQFRMRIQTVIEQKFRFCLGVSFVGCILLFALYMMTSENMGIINALFANCATILFCVTCFLILYKFELKNKWTLWLGEISYELYLCHMIVNKICRELIANEVWRIYCVIFSSIMIAFVFHKIDCRLDRYIQMLSHKVIKKNDI